MMRRGAAAVLAACGLMSTAMADTVGRIGFALPSADWQELVRYERRLAYNGGESNDPLYVAVFVLPGDGRQPRALLQLTSTRGGHRGGRVMWVSERCPEPREAYFADDQGTNRTTDRRDCLVVNARFAARAFFADDTAVTQAAADKGLEWPKSAASIRSLVATQTGELLRVHLMLARNLREGTGRAPAATQLWNVPAPLVALGEQLREATRTAALSLSGELKLPPFELEP